jgi:hypothetical protein
MNVTSPGTHTYSTRNLQTGSSQPPERPDISNSNPQGSSLFKNTSTGNMPSSGPSTLTGRVSTTPRAPPLVSQEDLARLEQLPYVQRILTIKYPVTHFNDQYIKLFTFGIPTNKNLTKEIADSNEDFFHNVTYAHDNTKLHNEEKERLEEIKQGKEIVKMYHYNGLLLIPIISRLVLCRDRLLKESVHKTKEFMAVLDCITDLIESKLDFNPQLFKQEVVESEDLRESLKKNKIYDFDNNPDDFSKIRHLASFLHIYHDIMAGNYKSIISRFEKPIQHTKEFETFKTTVRDWVLAALKGSLAVEDWNKILTLLQKWIQPTITSETVQAIREADTERLDLQILQKQEYHITPEELKNYESHSKPIDTISRFDTSRGLLPLDSACQVLVNHIDINGHPIDLTLPYREEDSHDSDEILNKEGLTPEEKQANLKAFYTSLFERILVSGFYTSDSLTEEKINAIVESYIDPDNEQTLESLSFGDSKEDLEKKSYFIRLLQATAYPNTSAHLFDIFLEKFSEFTQKYQFKFVPGVRLSIHVDKEDFRNSFVGVCRSANISLKNAEGLIESSSKKHKEAHRGFHPSTPQHNLATFELSWNLTLKGDSYVKFLHLYHLRHTTHQAFENIIATLLSHKKKDAKAHSRSRENSQSSLSSSS